MQQSELNPNYLPGHDPEEISRLIRQAEMHRRFTERLLHCARIEPGQRILDVGCGAGDVTMLAAKLVGATGKVVGIDRNDDVLTMARARAKAAGFNQIEFKPTSVEEFETGDQFDGVVGRFVLIHQQSPADFLRVVAAKLCRGGVLVLHETRTGPLGRSTPVVPLWKEVSKWLEAGSRALPSPDAADRLIKYFAAAGLPQPHLISENPIGGGADSALYRWVADLVWVLLPRLVQEKEVTAESVAIETLESRLRAAVVSADSQIEAQAQIGAWARV
jgi:ubiquinone/menaquinone biosynthesis C-methylase UbiE